MHSAEKTSRQSYLHVIMITELEVAVDFHRLASSPIGLWVYVSSNHNADSTTPLNYVGGTAYTPRKEHCYCGVGDSLWRSRFCRPYCMITSDHQLAEPPRT